MTLSPAKLKVYKKWCKRCGICVAFCPGKALSTDRDGFPYLADEKSCDRCGLCELRCPDFAIEVHHEARRVAARK